MTLEAGTTLGSYELIASIGVGAMGEIYRATDLKLGREVALKVLLPELASDPDRPTQQLTWSLLPGAPASATIDPDTGAFAWTPTNDDVPGPHPITIVVADDGSPARQDSTTFAVAVEEE